MRVLRLQMHFQFIKKEIFIISARFFFKIKSVKLESLYLSGRLKISHCKVITDVITKTNDENKRSIYLN